MGMEFGTVLIYAFYANRHGEYQMTEGSSLITSDDLGEMGEGFFTALCAQAGLICNKANRDRTGWDFIVEQRFSGSGSALDEREKPLSFYVQLKTIKENTRRISWRLSSAEYLAKEEKPSFICILRVDQNNQFTGASLIHMLNEPLDIVDLLRKSC
jgi:hypothetical protein